MCSPSLFSFCPTLVLFCSGSTPNHTGVTMCGTQVFIQAKASSYTAQYPVLRTIQSAIHFTSLTDLFTQTPSRLLWEASSHMLQLIREGCSYTYPPLSIARYSLIQLGELEKCRVKKLAQGFNTITQDSNPGSRSQESEALPMSHCALHEQDKMSPVQNLVVNTCMLSHIHTHQLRCVLWPEITSKQMCDTHFQSIIDKIYDFKDFCPSFLAVHHQFSDISKKQVSCIQMPNGQGSI